MRKATVKQGRPLEKKFKSMQGKKFRMPIQFQFRVVIYPSNEKKNSFIAHCLELDVMGQGKSIEGAVSELLEIIEVQIENSKANKIEPFFPAPKEIWQIYQKARESKRQLPSELMERIITNANKRLGKHLPAIDIVVPSEQIPDEMLTVSG